MNDNYIIAKQVALQSVNNAVPEQNEAQFVYWFIDMHAHMAFGSLDEQTLQEQK